MRRREFIAELGTAAAWPVMGLAQQDGRMRRIRVLTNLPADDALMQGRNGAFPESHKSLTGVRRKQGRRRVPHKCYSAGEASGLPFSTI
jgi:hypothetical protein